MPKMDYLSTNEVQLLLNEIGENKSVGYFATEPLNDQKYVGTIPVPQTTIILLTKTIPKQMLVPTEKTYYPKIVAEPIQ